MNKVEFGNLLRSQREKQSKTQTECANVCGVCLEAYQKWERGLSFPKTDNLKSICAYLNVTKEMVQDK